MTLKDSSKSTRPVKEKVLDSWRWQESPGTGGPFWMMEVCVTWSHALGRTGEDPISAKQSGLDHQPLVLPQVTGAYVGH